MQQVLARKNVQKTTFEAAEMMLGPWDQQSCTVCFNKTCPVLMFNFEKLRALSSLYIKSQIPNDVLPWQQDVNK